MPPSTEELLLRLLGAVLLGGLIGLEREMATEPAGLRTHLLVSLGAALFSMAGLAIGGDGPLGSHGDSGRIAAQVVTGIGFLGAGAILQRGLTVRGLTTAASLWVTAAVGLAVGLGQSIPAMATAAVAVAALRLLKPLERRLSPKSPLAGGGGDPGGADHGGGGQHRLTALVRPHPHSHRTRSQPGPTGPQPSSFRGRSRQACGTRTKRPFTRTSPS
jgi:putative Mg2+ transporter-C (MgtC) family protein